MHRSLLIIDITMLLLDDMKLLIQVQVSDISVSSPFASFIGGFDKDTEAFKCKSARVFHSVSISHVSVRDGILVE